MLQHHHNHGENHTFSLSEIIGDTRRVNISTDSIHGANETRMNNDKVNPVASHSFDERLHAALQLEDNEHQQHLTEISVRSLFRHAGQALQLEINHQNLQLPSSAIDCHAHWVPGRVEVMGKHTDYAGGNSLVFATHGRGMAMVSYITSNCDDSSSTHNNGSQNCNDDHSRGLELEHGVTVTIVSVLPPGMEERAHEKSMNTSTVAPFHVNQRPVVHLTTQIPSHFRSDNDNIIDNTRSSTMKKGVGWTVYPLAVIHRLQQNFGLLPHSTTKKSHNDCNNNTNCNNNNNVHIYIAISSNLPPASGLSTSSTLVTGLFLVLDSHLDFQSTDAYRHAIIDTEEEKEQLNHDFDADYEDNNTHAMCHLATYLGNVENGQDYVRKGKDKEFVLEGAVKGGVGTFGGSEDHAAILMGKKNELRLLSFCPTKPSTFNITLKNGFRIHQKSKIILPQDVSFVVAYSGAKAEKAGRSDGAATEASVGYNFAVELAKMAVDAYTQGSIGIYDSTLINDKIETLMDVIKFERVRLGISNNNCLIDQQQHNLIKSHIIDMIRSGSCKVLSNTPYNEKMLVERFEQFYDESECLVPTAAYALSRGDYDLLGRTVDASHHRAVNILKNQIKETAWLPLWARGMENSLNLDPVLWIDNKTEAVSQAGSEVAEEKISCRIKAIASSCFGAGFGGSCWALVHSTQAEEFALQWKDAYDKAFPLRNGMNATGLIRDFFVCNPGPGAVQL